MYCRLLRLERVGGVVVEGQRPDFRTRIEIQEDTRFLLGEEVSRAEVKAVDTLLFCRSRQCGKVTNVGAAIGSEIRRASVIGKGIAALPRRDGETRKQLQSLNHQHFVGCVFACGFNGEPQFADIFRFR